MAKLGDQKGIIEQINNKKNAKGKGAGNDTEKKSIAEFFKSCRIYRTQLTLYNRHSLLRAGWLALAWPEVARMF